MAHNSITYSETEQIALLGHFALKYLSLPTSYQSKFQVLCPSCGTSFSTSLMILKKYKDRGDTKKLCTPCSQREASQRTLQKSTVISEIEQKHNIRLLEPFNGTKNKHNFQCSCGKTFIDLPYNIAKKDQIDSCFCSSKKIVVKHDLSRMGDQLLAYGVTNFTWGSRGRQQKVNLSCEECNAIFSRNYNKLLNHDPKLCQRCLNKSISQTRSGANLLSDVRGEVQRLGFQKKKLQSLSTYSQDKSEWQIMSESGWNRIWDCGTLVFKLF